MAGAELITHDGIFFEVLAYFSDEGPTARANAAADVHDAIRSMRVLPANRPLVLRALELYEDRGIQQVLTNDHHFEQAGFTLVNQ